MDSSPMTVVQDSETAATVTIHTDPSAHDLVESAISASTSVNGTNHGSSVDIQRSIYTSTNQTDWLIVAANSLQASTHITTEDPSDQASIGIQAGDWITGIKGARFYGNGKYITGYVDTTDELSKLLDNYQTITGTSFPTMQQLNLTTKTSEDDYLQQRFLTPSARPRLFWQNHASEPIIPFDGVPFISVGQGTEVPCVRAGRRKTATQLLVATGDILPTKVRTHGCSAKVSIRRILRYPSSRLPDVGVQGITVMRRLRKQVLDVLTAKICAGLVKPSERYYISLPTPLAHDTHIVPEVEDPPSLIEPIHEQILSHIGQGITSTGHIFDRIAKFVNETYSSNPSINIQDPTFSPTRYGLTRYIYWLYKSGRAVDQECPFKERYNILNDEPTSVTTAVSTTSNTTTNISGGGSVDSIVTNTQDDTLANIYNMTASSDGTSIHQLSLATTPQIGAEETASTDVISLTDKSLTDDINQVGVSKATSNLSPMLIATPKSSVFDTSKDEITAANDFSVKQSREEVRCILRIIENQTYACNNTTALNVLRRQLTSLCTELSMHLAGAPPKSQRTHDLVESSSSKRVRLQ